MTTFAKTTIKGVQLVRAGNWNGMTGKADITTDDLADAVLAYHDPEVDHAVLKIGHDGDLNLGTGQPALGWIENIKLAGDTLVGDLVDIPSKLASIIPTAFRRRSVEMKRNLTTPSGKTYKLALDGLALLGAKAPAVKGLEDIFALYASEGDDTTSQEVIAFAVDGDLDTSPVPHAPNGSGDAGNGEAPTEASTDERTADVALSEALKKKLGLPDDATDEQIETALEAADLKPAEKPAENTGGNAGGNAPVETPATGDGVELGEADEQGFVKVSKVVFGEMQTDLAALKATESTRRRNAALDDAIRTGRISPAERVKFAAAMEKSEEATIVLLSELAPRFNVSIELGADAAPHAEQDTTTDEDWDASGL